MFETFTDRAREVMRLAEIEARRRSDAFIGTEHLLLALVSCGPSIAQGVLLRRGVEPLRVRDELARVLEDSSGPHANALRFTPRGQRAVEVAIEEADRFHQQVGTGHLLVGVLDQTSGMAARMLFNLDTDLDTLRAELLGLLGGQDTSATDG